MFSWAFRTLWKDRNYALAAAGGVAAALLVVLLVEGMFVGESRQIIAYPQDLNADLWVAQDGVSNMHMATSFIDSGKETRIAELPGVASTSSLLYVNGFVSDGDREWFAYIVGIHDYQPEAGPGVPVEGKRVPGNGETVIPRVLADKLGAGIGDRVQVANEPVTVAGIMDGYFSMANSIAFVDFNWLQDLMDSFNTVSYIVVRTEPGTKPQVLEQRITDTIEGVEVVRNETFINNDLRIGLQMGGELIAIMSVVSGIVAALVVAWCVMVLVARYQQELAIAKAVGARNFQVIAAVALQALLITFFGYLLSVLLALSLQPLLAEWVPDVAIRFPLYSFQRNGLLSLVVALVAALIPAWRVVSVDPVEVFK
jgi:putative ABC transport system permease protein